MITYNLLKQLEQNGADLSGLALSLTGTTTKIKVKSKGPAKMRQMELTKMFNEKPSFNSKEEAIQSGFICIRDISQPWTTGIAALAKRTNSNQLIGDENCFGQVGTNSSFKGSYIHKLTAQKACLI